MKKTSRAIKWLILEVLDAPQEWSLAQAICIEWKMATIYAGLLAAFIFCIYTVK